MLGSSRDWAQADQRAAKGGVTKTASDWLTWVVSLSTDVKVCVYRKVVSGGVCKWTWTYRWWFISSTIIRWLLISPAFCHMISFHHHLIMDQPCLLPHDHWLAPPTACDQPRPPECEYLTARDSIIVWWLWEFHHLLNVLHPLEIMAINEEQRLLDACFIHLPVYGHHPSIQSYATPVQKK